MGTPPAWSLAMRSRSMSVQTTSCPASARQAPVTSPTYPHPMTERRKGKPPSTELNSATASRFPSALGIVRDTRKRKKSFLFAASSSSLAGRQRCSGDFGLDWEQNLQPILQLQRERHPRASDYNFSIEETRTRV